MLQGSAAITVAVSLAAALTMTVGGAAAADAKYPNWKGQWVPVHAAGSTRPSGAFDPSKPEGLGQQAPLTQD
jgi:hypothetical protein